MQASRVTRTPRQLHMRSSCTIPASCLRAMQQQRNAMQGHASCRATRTTIKAWATCTALAHKTSALGPPLRILPAGQE